MRDAARIPEAMANCVVTSNVFVYCLWSHALVGLTSRNNSQHVFVCDEPSYYYSVETVVTESYVLGFSDYLF